MVSPGTKQRAVCGDIESPQVTIAECAICRMVRWYGMRFNDPAVRSKNVDHRTRTTLFPARRGDDVALHVQAHAVDAAVRVEVVQHLVLADRAVVADRDCAHAPLLGS